MTRLNLVALILLVFMGLAAFAEEDQTTNVFAAQNQSVCAHGSFKFGEDSYQLNIPVEIVE
jgi:hypothetical protein